MIKINDILNTMVPFDDSNKADFEDALRRFPYLRDNLEEEINFSAEDTEENKVRSERMAKLRQAAETQGFYFIVNNVSWKHPGLGFKPSSRVNFVGNPGVPTLSIDI